MVGASASNDVRPGEQNPGGVPPPERKEEEQVEAQEEEADRGVRKPARMSDPREPSEEERKEHEMTHLPYRSWCKHCVGGRGKDAPHKRQDAQGELHEMHLDYGFVGEEGEAGKTVTMLVARERKTRMTMATAVPTKSTGKFVVERVWAFMREMGIEHLDVIVKSDQEPAIKHLVDEIGRRKAEAGGRWIRENSPVGSHASNGVVERGIQSVEGQVRVMKSALEGKWGLKIEAKHAVIPWIMEYAAHLLNRFEVGHDGRTAHERCKGKRAKSMGIEFGEGVLWKRKPVGGALGKLSVMWKEGVYLGVKGRTGEFVVGDEKGVWKTRTLQRTPAGRRWDPKNAELIRGVPWNMNAEDDEADGDNMEVIRVGPEDAEAAAQKQDKEQFGDIPVPRRVKIGKNDLREHGYTARCEGCRAALAGKPAKPHSEECRARMEKLMKGNPKMQAAQKRMNEFFEKVAEAQDKKDAKEGEEAQGKRRKVEESASSSGAAGAEKRRPALSEGEEGPPRKEPKTEEKTGTKRGQEALEEPVVRMEVEEEQVEKMAVEEVAETNDEPDAVNEWDDKWDEGEYVDQKTGNLLDPALAKAARLEEIAFMKKIGLYEEVPVEECWEKTGKAPTSTRWVDVNKGTVEKPDVRCRLVARDFKPKGEKDREDLFAAMPPLESKKLIFQKAIRENKERRRRGQDGIKLMFIDVKKAHLYGVVPEGECAYIELPGEAERQGKCGRLVKWLYGMRNAASAWEKHYSDRLAEMGFAKSRVAPTAFYNEEREVRCVVHGDDFTFSGRRSALQEIAEQLKETYELKVRGTMGDEPGDDKEIVILNRSLRWTEEGLEYRADDKHVREILKYFGLDENSKGLSAAVAKESAGEDGGEEEELGAEKAKEYRALAARANYLALDRPDIQYAAKEVCRDMSKPTAGSMARIKRLARYLLEHPQAIIKFRAEGGGSGRIDVYSDSDWAGCTRSRRSTTGGIMMVDGGAVKTWSSTQATVAQSSGEAEYYAMVRAAAEGLGMRAIMGEMGWEAEVRVWADSSAAKSIASRIGLGKVRHMEVKFLWLQEAVKARRVEVRKVAGVANPADVLTKPKSYRESAELLEGVGVRVASRGREAITGGRTAAA